MGNLKHKIPNLSFKLGMEQSKESKNPEIGQIQIPPKITDIDDVLERTKPFGRYQILMTIVYSYMYFPGHLNDRIMSFAGITPKWTCSDATFNDTSMPTDNCTIYDQCSPENLTFVSDFYSVASEWSLVCDRAYLIQLITSIQMIGLLIGGMTTGPIADLYGRKRTFLVVVTCSLVLGAVSSLSSNVTIFMVYRFFIGITLGAQFVVGCVFAAEFTTNRYRLLMQSVAITLFGLWNVVLVAYATKHWKWYSIVGNVEGVFLIPLIAFFTHESPRWLVQKGRIDEATQILRAIAKFNGTSDHLPETIALETESKQGDVKKYYIWDLFRTRRLAIYTLVSVFTWFGVSFSLYGMYFDIGYLPTNVYTNSVMLAGAGMVVVPLSVFEAYNKNVNRKFVQVALILLTGLCNVAIALFESVIPESVNSDVILSICSIVGQVATEASFGILYVLSIELFPTLLRSQAGALNSMGARIGAIIAPQLLYARKSWKPLPYVCFAAVCGLAAILDAVFLPNTKNMHLPETYKQGAGENGHSNEGKDTRKVAPTDDIATGVV